MVTDFFYPQTGGVESHVFFMAQELQRQGHKVVVVTHRMGDRVGVRYLTNNLKTYHVPTLNVYGESTLPTLFSFFPIFRHIFLREQVDIVHGHQACSAFCMEAILHARVMGIKAVFTDHSLFGFGDAGAIFINKVLKFALADVSHVICVSHTARANTALRAEVDPARVSVLPNAIISARFLPSPTPEPQSGPTVTVVALSRLVYRKGVDLLLAVIPRVCAVDPHVRFVIAGDGPKRVAAEQMREAHCLHDRVRLLGSVPHDRVSSVLAQGDVFLNCSLTEAFCIGIVEAASCGLLVVATRVGGVPEVLPEDMALLAEPRVDAIVAQLLCGIQRVRDGNVDRAQFHARVKKLYSWEAVARNTVTIYRSVLGDAEASLAEKLLRYRVHSGRFAGLLAMGIVALEYLLWAILELVYPRRLIDAAPRLYG